MTGLGGYEQGGKTRPEIASIGEALRQVTTDDILGWFAHAGYAM